MGLFDLGGKKRKKKIRKGSKKEDITKLIIKSIVSDSQYWEKLFPPLVMIKNKKKSIFIFFWIANSDKKKVKYKILFINLLATFNK